jgi:transcriptional regulator with XRE-family HTH domain
VKERTLYDYVLLCELLKRGGQEDGPLQLSADRREGMFANVGKALIRLRERTGLSQAAVARKAGCGKSQLSKYENDRELPKLDSLERVLNALEVNYIHFFWIVFTIDQKDSHPTLSRGEIDDLFSRLSRGIFTLHGQVIKELPDEHARRR